MARDRRKIKGRKEEGRFLGLPIRVIDSPAYLSLSWSARALLVDIGRQYKGPGSNNGALMATFKLMKDRGWRSTSTLQKAKDELLDTGLIIETRMGGKHLPALYAVSWKPIDECGGIHHAKPTDVAPGTWKEWGN